ncbi:uncharacterized protein Z520_10483 [Fonsecaea multimorphosa CBS 102226]|uniref:Uncharacterized protein n=1 Tax=Fonsecaea multimorphosa CBS 102226 TaxID=1442371 RepID=A0A0D2KBA5_9EURO|nr:uncharacterized protein Z520_10483 [Fonsecaea multimorphosa CBS 102226]KIX93858.1 hypothetical protein Z520_10483 [Fonsecaea multimorphosa CBS 102226]OAL19096.1 hypothetical protein AYO22_10044 [Fonsecaea multimorphosa]
MSDQSYRKPLFLAIAGAVALTAAYYTYTQYAKPPRTEQSSLHRSNAIRRPRNRRRWRRGFELSSIDYDPVERAIHNLEQRNASRRGYGEYENRWFLPTQAHTQAVDLTLIPSNLRSINDYLLQHSPAQLSPHQQEYLLLHLHGVFVQNFLREECPEGYIIGDDAWVLAQAMERLGVAPDIVFQVAKAFDEGRFPLNDEWSPLTAPRPSSRTRSVQTDGVTEQGGLAPREALQALADPDDAHSDISSGNNDEDPEGSQNMLDLLYHIAGEQARREGYIHRGVECNSCGIHPIRGIRYHCANCFDMDLCESCEASSAHGKGHVFYKIRIPAPSRGNIKQVTPEWYPGNPSAFLSSLPTNVSKPLLEETKMERTELDALYEQFKCLAGHYFPADPTGLGCAIDRKGFDAYFIPSTGDKPSPANLIYDRIFAFYDTDQNGLITFDEYIRGLARLQDKSRYARLKRIFEGYDLDSDGYVDRKDFLRMFRAYYALSKELSREMIDSQEDFGYNEEEIREVVQGSQPISAAFGGGTLYGHESRNGQGKQLQANGDLHLTNGTNGVLQPDGDMSGDRARAIGNAALGGRTRNHPFRSFRQEPPEDEPLMMLPMGSNFMQSGMEQDEPTEEDVTGPDAPLQTYAWPPVRTPEPQDINEALGQEVPLDDITDPVDRTRVLFAQSQRLDAEGDQAEEMSRARAVEERWRRRQFYLDREEGLTRPAGYTEPDSSDDDDISQDKKNGRSDVSPRRASMASRSSSKVRFDDSAIEGDYETRSNASSRSIPANERWGGYELGQAEADIGKDILYQAVQQGFNELLDVLFKDKEDEHMEARETRVDRHCFGYERAKFEKLLDELGMEADETEEDLVEKIRRRREKEREQEQLAMTDAAPMTNSGNESSVPQDSEDHIGLMFGSEALSAQQVTMSPAIAMTETNGPYRDPTLPQFRPDETEPPSLAASAAPIPPSQIPRPDPFAGDPEKALKTHYLWLRHDEIDEEEDRRGGPGKLSFAEFQRKMVSKDEVTKALGDKDKSKCGGKDRETWESSADLGRLAFVGTWLEMASF